MKIQQIHDWLFLINGTVLITHQIDAAYWHEWELFGMPGGVQMFLLLNLPVVLLVLYGPRAHALNQKSGIAISWLLVAGGLFAVSIHTFFLLGGDEAFTLPISLGLLVATFVLSLVQAAVLVIFKYTL